MGGGDERWVTFRLERMALDVPEPGTLDANAAARDGAAFQSRFRAAAVSLARDPRHRADDRLGTHHRSDSHRECDRKRDDRPHPRVHCDRAWGSQHERTTIPFRFFGHAFRFRRNDEWLATFADPMRAQAAIDRFTRNAYDLVIDGESYRARLKPGQKGGQKGEKKGK